MKRLLALALVLLAPANALAYRTSEDSLYNQRSGITGRIAFAPLPVPYAIYHGSVDVPFDQLQTATRTAFETWGEPACSAVTIRDGGTTTTPVIWGDDQNVLEWVESGWSGRGFGAFTIGVTTNQFLYDGTRWTIDESDMELNGDGFDWVIEGGSPDARPVDVQGLVVHEAGHFLGLLHPCEQTPFDGAPACGTFTDPIATMAPIYAGEAQRTLEADDVAGICYLYPAPPGTDAGVPMLDAGVPMLDAGTVPSDAGTTPMSDASMTAFDGGEAPADGGAPPGESGGCSCRAVPPRPTVGAWTFVLGLLVWRRGRQGRRRSTQSST
ncbi:MAG: hypothetical protein R3B82_16965 [Sandaracinaceae bacterium]